MSVIDIKKTPVPKSTLNQVRQKEYASNLECSIQFRMFIKAHQDVHYEQSKRKDTSSTTISRNNGGFLTNDQSFGQNSLENLKRDKQQSESMVNFDLINRSIEIDEDKGAAVPSLSYIHNALNQITEEEKKKSIKQRLTQLQKNRIALNYVKIREEARSRKGTDNSVVIESQPKKKDQQVQQMMDSIIDYVSNQNVDAASRSNEFIRSRTLQKRKFTQTAQKPKRDSLAILDSYTETNFGAKKTAHHFLNVHSVQGIRPVSSNSFKTQPSSNSQNDIRYTRPYDPMVPNLLKSKSNATRRNAFKNEHSLSKSTIYDDAASSIPAKPYFDNYKMNVINENPHPVVQSVSQVNILRSSINKTAEHAIKLERLKKTCQRALKEKPDDTISKIQMKLQSKLDQQRNYRVRQEKTTSPVRHRRLKLKLQNFLNQQSGVFDFDEEIQAKLEMNTPQRIAVQKLESVEEPRSLQILKSALSNKPYQNLRIFQNEEVFNSEIDTEYQNNNKFLNQAKRQRYRQGGDECLTEKVQQTIEKINQFEQSESFNKVSVNEISNKYKQFNQRRNMRLKNKTKLDLM